MFGFILQIIIYFYIYITLSENEHKPGLDYNIQAPHDSFGPFVHFKKTLKSFDKE